MQTVRWSTHKISKYRFLYTPAHRSKAHLSIEPDSPKSHWEALQSELCMRKFLMFRCILKYFLSFFHLFLKNNMCILENTLSFLQERHATKNIIYNAYICVYIILFALLYLNCIYIIEIFFLPLASLRYPHLIACFSFIIIVTYKGICTHI